MDKTKTNSHLSKFIRYEFLTVADRDSALHDIANSEFKSLMTKVLDSEFKHYLFVQTTGSLIHDLLAKNSIEAIITKNGGSRGA